MRYWHSVGLSHFEAVNKTRIRKEFKMIERLATRYSRSATTVSSFDDIQGIIREKFPNEVKRLELPSFNVRGTNGDFVRPRFHGLFLVDADGIPVAEVGDSSVSPKYVPHSREDIETLVEASRQAFQGDLMVDAVWNEGHTIVVKPTKETFLELYSEERISPKLAIHAGFAGKPIQASLGFYNTICDNMAILRSVLTVSRTIKHTLSMRDRLDELVQEFQSIRASWKETQERIQRMNEIRVNTADILRAVFGDIPETGRGRTVAENRIEKIVTRLNNESMKVGNSIGMETTGWRLFNALQGAFQHDFTRKQGDSYLRALDTWNDATLEKAERIILAC